LIPAFIGKRLWFPDPVQADDEGLVAVGGDLSIERLLLAYRSGIFPWFIHDDLVYWFSPNPRCILIPEEIKISKSMRQILNQKQFEITFNNAFEAVMRGCATAKRPHQESTWITEDFIEAYVALHKNGYGHSVEVWQQGELVGGLYGVALGKVFFGESMFSLVTNASKAALISLAEKLNAEGFHFIECQLYTPHLGSLGAKAVSRKEYLKMLSEALV
jgi:leucyl/phenylalanyl-tRNA--protein transferase